MSNLVSALQDYHEFKTNTYPEYKKVIKSQKEADDLEEELSDYFKDVVKESQIATTAEFAQALEAACASGYHNIVELLLKNAGVAPLWDDEHDPIAIAFANEQIEIIKLLIANNNIQRSFRFKIGDNANEDNLRSCFVAAILSADKELIALASGIVRQTFALNPDGFTQFNYNNLQFAARNGLVELAAQALPYLLMDKKETAFKIDQAITQAAQQQHSNIIIQLLDARKDLQPPWNDTAMLYDAFCNGETLFISDLLENETIMASLLNNIQEEGFGKNGVDFALRVAVLSKDEDKALLKLMLKNEVVRNYLLKSVNEGNDYLIRLALTYADGSLVEALTQHIVQKPRQKQRYGIINIDPQEWEIARKHFADHPHDVKYKKKSKSYHSFIKVDDRIYAISSREMLGGKKPGVLGEGGFGKVKIAQSESGLNFAIKVEGASLKEDRDAELQIMRLLQFTQGQAVRKIPEKLFKDKLTKTKLYTIMELKEGKELQKLIFENRIIETLSEEQRIGLALACCQAIQDLHQHRIIHGDIKPANFMTNIEGDNIVIAAIDFGLSARLAQDNDVIIKEKKGSEGYIAPEIEQSGEFSFKSDVYALGQMLQNDLKLPSYIVKEMINASPDKRCDLSVVIKELHLLLNAKSEQSQKRAASLTTKRELHDSKEKAKLAKEHNKENRSKNSKNPKK